MNKRFQLRVAAGIPSRTNLVEQPHRRQLGINGESRFNNRFVRIELRRDRRPRSVPHRLAVEIAIEIARANAPVDRVATDAQLAGQRTLTRAVLQVVPE